MLGDAESRDPAKAHVTIAVSGAYGGYTIDFRRLAVRGITLLGRADAFADGVMRFAPGLARDLAAGDASYLSLLDAADAYAAREGLDLPEEPAARVAEPDPSCVTAPTLRLDLRDAGITTIIWATGFAFDFGWLRVGALDTRGASQAPGASSAARTWANTARAVCPGAALSVPPGVELHLWGGTGRSAAGGAYRRAAVGDATHLRGVDAAALSGRKETGGFRVSNRDKQTRLTMAGRDESGHTSACLWPLSPVSALALNCPNRSHDSRWRRTIAFHLQQSS